MRGTCVCNSRKLYNIIADCVIMTGSVCPTLINSAAGLAGFTRVDNLYQRAGWILRAFSWLSLTSLGIRGSSGGHVNGNTMSSTWNQMEFLTLNEAKKKNYNSRTMGWLVHKKYIQCSSYVLRIRWISQFIHWLWTLIWTNGDSVHLEIQWRL